ncbi:MAG: hypothetical protein KAU50_03950 [Candidatus Marinimicrobia bacterium]|nr:hypothetical protein [Candidatus Neomarinimicrobiota bacterium]
MGETKERKKVIDKTIHEDYSLRLPMTISKVRCLNTLLIVKSYDSDIELTPRDIEGLSLILRDIEDDLEGINQELCKE